MDKYKLSCPRCGQHIEYTRDYCGHHVQCPSCNGNVTFPALPPSSGKTPLRLERDRVKVKEPFRFDIAKILGSTLAFFRTFEHWQIVAMCAVPFLLIALGLGAVSFLHKQDTRPKPDAPALSSTEIAENERISARNQAEVIVQDRVKTIWTAKNSLDTAQRKRAALHKQYDGKQMSTAMRNAVEAQYKVLDEEVAAAESNLNGWRRTFDTAYANYQKFGGKVDYQSQLPK